MCQYSSEDGVPTDWHLVHLGSRAVGGAGLVMMEATSVTPEGRISPWDMGIWNDAQAEAMKRVTHFIESEGALPAIQLAHAGRKASVNRPWLGGRSVPPGEGGWVPVGPSALPFDDKSPRPDELSVGDIDRLVEAFAAAAVRSVAAGFRVIELHFAHGYLACAFLSPLSNLREDEYGGSIEGRARFALRVTRAVRDVIPADMPLFARISSTEWVDEGGWSLADSVVLAGWLKEAGVDLIDCSSGGNSPRQRLTPFDSYQVPFAEEIRRKVGVLTGAVGLITRPEQAEEIIASGKADAVLLGRELLRDPHWPLHAAHALGADVPWPKQYVRARPPALGDTLRQPTPTVLTPSGASS